MTPAVPVKADEPNTVLFLDSERFAIGSGSVTGEERTLTVPESTFEEILADPQGVHFNVRHPVAFPWDEAWIIRMFAPTGQDLAVGTYAGAQRFPDDGVAGLDVGGNGQGCNQVTGSFTVHELQRAADAEIIAFAASFQEACGPGGAQLRGEIRYASGVPIRAIDVDLHEHPFGLVDFGTSSAAQSITVSNTGSLPLALAVTTAGTDPTDFDVTKTCTGELAVATSCTIDAVFDPIDVGARTAQIIISDDTPRGSRLTIVSGTGMGSTATTLEPPSGDAVYPTGDELVATVRTTTTSPSTPQPLGAIRFVTEGGLVVGHVGVDGDSGIASGRVILPPGTTRLRAQYLGAVPYRPSSSDWLDLTADRGTAVRLTVSTPSARFGQPVVLHASVRGAERTPASGRLQLVDDTTGQILGDVPVTAASAELRIEHAFFQSGGHSIRAVYLPGTGFAGSSDVASITVVKVPTFVELSAAQTGVPAGTPVRLRARVVPVPPGGSVAFRDLGTDLAEVDISPDDGTAELVILLAVGHHRITATYPGTDEFGASEGGTLWVDVGVEPDEASPEGTVTIEEGVDWTSDPTLDLELVAQDPDPGTGVDSMRLSVAGSWSTWEPFASERVLEVTEPDGTVVVQAQFRDGAGNVSSVTADSVDLDRVIPSARAPTEAFRVGGTMTSTSVPVKVGFSGTDVGSGIAGYRGRLATNDVWAPAFVVSGTSATIRLRPGSTTWRLGAKSVDRAGNRSTWSAGRSFVLDRIEDSSAAMTYSGDWRRVSASAWSGGSVRAATGSGASARIRIRGRDVALVSNTGPNRGRAAIYIDGNHVATIDLYSPTFHNRRIVFSRAISPSGEHVLAIRPLGTRHPSSTGTRVDIDAVLAIR